MYNKLDIKHLIKEPNQIFKWRDIVAENYKT